MLMLRFRQKRYNTVVGNAERIVRAHMRGELKLGNLVCTVWLLKARALYELNRNDEARQVYKKILAWPHSRSHMVMAVARNEMRVLD